MVVVTGPDQRPRGKRFQQLFSGSERAALRRGPRGPKAFCSAGRDRGKSQGSPKTHVYWYGVFFSLSKLLLGWRLSGRILHLNLSSSAPWGTKGMPLKDERILSSATSLAKRGKKTLGRSECLGECSDEKASLPRGTKGSFLPLEKRTGVPLRNEKGTSFRLFLSPYLNTLEERKGLLFALRHQAN